MNVSLCQYLLVNALHDALHFIGYLPWIEIHQQRLYVHYSSLVFFSTSTS